MCAVNDPLQLKIIITIREKQKTGVKKENTCAVPTQGECTWLRVALDCRCRELTRYGDQARLNRNHLTTAFQPTGNRDRLKRPVSNNRRI